LAVLFSVAPRAASLSERLRRPAQTWAWRKTRASIVDHQTSHGYRSI